MKNYKVDFYLWRPVLAGLLSFSDLKVMTFMDLVDAHEALDIKEHIEAEQEKEIGGNNGSG